MIKVFSGNWRGLSEEEHGLFLMMDFRFRDILHLFHGAKLAVFLCLVLHSDKNGLSFPSYELIESETKYDRKTISKALDGLCNLTINGQRVLIRYRLRDERGLFVGSNRYLIFPTDEEVKEIESPQLKNSTLDSGSSTVEKFHVPKIPLEVINQSLSINHFKNTGAQNAPVGHTHAEKKGDVLDGILHFSGKSPSLDISEYPEDVRPVLVEFHRLWKVVPPTKRVNPSAYKLWIKESRAVTNACAEFGLVLMHRYYKKWVSEGRKLTIARVGSLINLLVAEAGIARQEKSTVRTVEAYDPEQVALFQQKLKAQREAKSNLST